MKNRSPITTHVLDLATGKPANGLSVTLEFQKSENQWTVIKKTATDQDGRIENFFDPSHELTPGIYRLQFETEAYFKKNSTESFYPYASVVFRTTKDRAHYHVPLLLNSYGFSTYRGT